jgi:type 2 lantibiotic biosynthesis protein LanM
MSTELDTILARAATPAERANANWLGREAMDVSARHVAWVAALAQGDDQELQRLLSARGIALEAHLFGLCDVKVGDRRSLPQWARELEELWFLLQRDCSEIQAVRLSEVAGSAGTSVEGEWIHSAALMPFLRGGAARLRAIVTESRVATTASAERALIVQLAARLGAVCNQVLLSEPEPRDILSSPPALAGETVAECYLGRAPSPAGWLAIWTAFPVLARAMACAFQRWQCATVEMLTRLASDSEELAAVLQVDGSLGALSSVQADRGDTHAGGRAVAILGFECGARVVYKPRDLRVAAAYERLATSLSPDLKLGRQLLLRDGYAWDPWVESHPCSTSDEQARFFQRVGQHARLLQWVRAVDMHHENAIGDGDKLCLIDLETLFSPGWRAEVGLPSADLALDEASQDAPTMSGLITCKSVGDAGRRGVELGAIAPQGPRAATRRSMLFVKSDGLAPKLVQDYGQLDVRSASLASASAHAEEIALGYRRMAGALREMAPDTLEAWLDECSELPVRYVLRQSQTYARLLLASLAPASLRDGLARELTLERLFLAHLRDGEHVAVIQAEVDALRELDIPLFEVKVDSLALTLPDGHSIPRYFAQSPRTLVRRRLDRLSHVTVASEVEQLWAALFIRDPETPSPKLVGGRPETGGRPLAPTPRGEPFLDAARSIGDVLCDAAIGASSDGSELGFCGPMYDVEHGVWTWRVLGEDLFSGAPGIAVVLAELGRLTCLPRYKNVALAVVRLSARRVRRRLAAREPLALGPFFGVAGVIYACQRVANHVGSSELALEARELSRIVLSSEARSESWADPLLGEMGWLFAPLPGNTTMRNRILEALRISGGVESEAAPNCVLDASELRALPTPAQVHCLARLRAADAWSEPSLRPEPALLRRAFVGDAASLAPGAVLAQLWALPFAPELAASVPETLAAYFANAKGSTSERLQAIEVAVSAYRVSGDTTYLAIARQHAEEQISERFARGRWFPAVAAPDRFFLSAFIGLAGLCHGFCQAHDPHATSSLRFFT